MAAITATETLPLDAAFETDLEAFEPVSLISQILIFLWLASGMFSISALAIAFGDYMVSASGAAGTTHFLAALVSAGLFGLATLLKLGPSEA